MLELKSISLIFSIFAPFTWLMAMIVSGMYKIPSKRHLVFLLGVASFVYIMTYAKFMGHLEFYTLLFPIQTLFVLLLFPLFYLYLLTLSSEKFEYNWKYFIHYLMPGILFLTYFVVSKMWMNQEEEIKFMQNLLESNRLPGNKFGFAYYLYCFGRYYYLASSILYIMLMTRIYRSYKNLIINIFPSDFSRELNWIKTISILLLIVVLLNLVIHIMRNNDLADHDILIALSYFTFGSFFWILGLFGFNQSEIYNETAIQDTEKFSTGKKISKKDIETFLLNEKPYLKSDISVYDFCYKFETNRTYLSAIINQQFKMNFRALINSYRIEEAKKQIDGYSKNENAPSFEQIASDVGFYSYSSFLRVFKMNEGITPSEYYRINTHD